MPSSRATTTFCWLPPDSVPAFTRIDGVRTSNSVTHSCARSRIASSSRTRPRENGRVLIVVEDDVVGDRERQDQRRTDDDRRGRSRRPASCRSRGDADGHVLVAERHAAGRLAPQPHDRLDQLVLAVAGDAGDSEDLAGANLEADAVDDLVPTVIGDPEVLGLEHDVRPACSSPRSTVSWTSRPTISSARSSSFVSDGMREPTTFPRRMTVMRSAISRTSYSLWLMKMTDVPSSFVSWRRTAKISRVSCGVSTAVGSSRTRMRRAAIERLEDLDALLPAHRQRADLRVGVDLEAELLAELPDASRARRADRGRSGWPSARRRGGCSRRPSGPGRA